MATTSNQILLDAVNAANNTHYTLNDVSIHPQAAGAGGAASAVLRQQLRTDNTVCEVTVNYNKIDIATILIQPEGFIESAAQTQKQLMYEINKRYNTQFNGSDLLIDGNRVSNVFTNTVGQTFVTEVTITCTSTCASYYGTAVLKFKLPGPMLYGDPVEGILSDAVTKSINDNNGFIQEAGLDFIRGTGKVEVASGAEAQVMADWSVAGSEGEASTLICPLFLPVENSGTRIAIAGVDCYLNRTMAANFVTTEDGGQVLGAYMVISMSFPTGTTPAQKQTVNAHLRTISSPQGFLFLELLENGVVLGSVVGYRTKSSAAGSANPELDDDSVLYFQLDWQDDMITEDAILVETIMAQFDSVDHMRIVDGRKYHFTDRTSRIPTGNLHNLLGEAYPSDYGAVEPATDTLIRSIINRDVIRTSFGKGVGYEYPVDYVQGDMPDIRTGSGFLEPHPGIVQPSLNTITFPTHGYFRVGWVHYGEWDNRVNRMLSVALTIINDEPWSATADSTAITGHWNDLLDELRASPDWNEEIGPVCFLQHVPEGNPSASEICTIKTLFMPKIVGNAVIFTGVRDYGNRPGTRCYTPHPNCVALGNGKYYPN